MDTSKRMAEILQAEAKAISRVKVTDAFQSAATALFCCSGKVITTGMGKAGHVARKFASTLSSTKTPAVFIHPGEAAHGDLGVIGEGDILFVFSTSGKTREVLELIEMAGALYLLKRTIGMTSHADSKMRSMVDTVIDMGIIKEPCPLGLTPTASSTVMMAISDAIALTVMEMKCVTAGDYGRRHHGGYIGKKAKQMFSEDAGEPIKEKHKQYIQSLRG
jgi:arabinose-5-phosphate isomerase